MLCSSFLIHFILIAHIGCFIFSSCSNLQKAREAHEYVSSRPNSTSSLCCSFRGKQIESPLTYQPTT
ncbi:hypothetical protein KC19_VG317700 [Ceratodon purpureus]|uniref:Uncharacterized protein n=1 Tax=Ceratodon purpureus TaxID=3225 RepID=A0A8T0HXA6_CERPU|nr:hypothetical protein KC19_VG317700 [Ceratodon purpureus]